LFETITAQSAPNPLVHADEFAPECREAVAGKPTHRKQVEFDDDLRKIHAPGPAGNPPDLLLRAIYALGRDSEFAVQQQPMAEQLTLPDRCDVALFTVYPKPEFVAVVGVAAEAMAPAFQ